MCSVVKQDRLNHETVYVSAMANTPNPNTPHASCPREHQQPVHSNLHPNIGRRRGVIRQRKVTFPRSESELWKRNEEGYPFRALLIAGAFEGSI
jgi:hypothetical protein